MKPFKDEVEALRRDLADLALMSRAPLYVDATKQNDDFVDAQQAFVDEVEQSRHLYAASMTEEDHRSLNRLVARARKLAWPAVKGSAFVHIVQGGSPGTGKRA